MENMRVLWEQYPDGNDIPRDGSIAKQELTYAAPLLSREIVTCDCLPPGQYDSVLFSPSLSYFLKRAAIVKYSAGQEGFGTSSDGYLLIGSLQGNDPENGWHYDADRLLGDYRRSERACFSQKGGYSTTFTSTYYTVHGGYLQYKENGIPVQDGWRQIRGEWFYFKDGIRLTGFLEIDGNTYLLKDIGRYSDGWMYPARVTEIYAGYGNRYFTPDGVMLKNTHTPDGFWVDENGEPQRIAQDTQGSVSANQGPRGEEATYIFQTINEIRTQNGKQPLQWSPERAAYLNDYLVKGNSLVIPEDYGLPSDANIFLTLPKYADYEEMKARDDLGYRDLGNQYLIHRTAYDKYILGDYQYIAVVESDKCFGGFNPATAHGCLVNFGN